MLKELKVHLKQMNVKIDVSALVELQEMQTNLSDNILK